MSLNSVGTPGGIIKPVIHLNGIPVSSVSIHSEAGTISTCDVGVKPEDLGNFSSPDTVGVVTADPGGTLFVGYVSGVGYSNMNGSLTPTVSLIHSARDLDETTSLIPGVM